MPFVNNSGIKIHYEVKGRGTPLVLVHGFSSTLNCWSTYGYVEELEKNNQLILLDVRGHGQSDKPHNEKDYDIKLLVGDIVAVLDSLQVSKANYFGYSMGGRIGFHIPFIAPDRFSTLIMGGWGFPRPGHEAEDRETGTFLRLSLEEAIKANPEKPMEAFVAAFEQKFGQVPQEIKAERLANDAYAIVAAIIRSAKSTDVNPAVVLPKTLVQCLIFAGEADPGFAAALESAKLLPNVTFFSLPGLDHAKCWERSDLVLPHVKEFLAKVNKQKH